MKSKTRGPATTLGEYRAQHEKKGHWTFFDAEIHLWRVHRCGGCTAKFFVVNESASKGADAPGEEWSWD